VAAPSACATFVPGVSVFKASVKVSEALISIVTSVSLRRDAEAAANATMNELYYENGTVTAMACLVQVLHFRLKSECSQSLERNLPSWGVDVELFEDELAAVALGAGLGVTGGARRSDETGWLTHTVA
jgi:hypothetical protein